MFVACINNMDPCEHFIFSLDHSHTKSQGKGVHFHIQSNMLDRPAVYKDHMSISMIRTTLRQSLNHVNYKFINVRRD